MNSIFKKNKKGSSIIDIIFILVVLVSVALGFFFVRYSFNDINADLLADPDLNTEAKATLLQGNNNYINWADATIGFLFFGLMLSILITSYLIDSHPIFFIASIISFIFVIFIAGNVGNLFYDTVEQDEYAQLQSDFPITMFIMDNLILLITITFVLTIIVLYGKGQNGLGSGGFQ